MVPKAGYKVFHSVPLVRTKPVFAPVLDADVRELQALDEFIKLKERQIARYIQVERNRVAITETEWLKNYLAEFPQRNHVATTNDPFWLDEYITNIKYTTTKGTDQHVKLCERARNLGHACQPPTCAIWTYFGPAYLEAQWIAGGGASTSWEDPRPQKGGHRRIVATQDIDLATQMNGDPFPAFDPHKTLELGHLLQCAPLNLREEMEQHFMWQGSCIELCNRHRGYDAHCLVLAKDALW